MNRFINFDYVDGKHVAAVSYKLRNVTSHGNYISLRGWKLELDEALCGRLPFEADTVEDMVLKHLSATPEHIPTECGAPPKAKPKQK